VSREVEDVQKVGEGRGSNVKWGANHSWKRGQQYEIVGQMELNAGPNNVKRGWWCRRIDSGEMANRQETSQFDIFSHRTSSCNEFCNRRLENLGHCSVQSNILLGLK